MRNRIMALIAALAVIVTGGAAALTLGGSAASAAVQSSSAARGWYIDANGIPRFLPMGSNAVPGQSGDYKGMWFKGLTLDPQSAPVKTVVTDSGATADGLKVVHKTVALDANSPASQTVVVTGIPAFGTASVFESYGDNSGLAPNGTRVTVSKPSPVTGSTERSFTVSIGNRASFKVGQTFTLDIWVLSVAP